MATHDLRESLEVEFESMRTTLHRIEWTLARAETPGLTENDITAAAAYAANLYAAVERTLKLFACELQVVLPTGGAWHRELLDLFGPSAEAPGWPIISEELRDSLDRYRAFRHVFVHGYAINLDWQRLEPVVRDANPVFEQFISRVEAFIRQLDRDS